MTSYKLSIPIILLFTMTACRTNMIFDLSTKDIDYIGSVKGTEITYSQDFKNTVDAIITNFGRKDYRIIYGKRGIVIYAKKRRNKILKRYLDGLPGKSSDPATKPSKPTGWFKRCFCSKDGKETTLAKAEQTKEQK